jgi:ABC-type uncharacterized transport system substrate-binding protein
VVSHAPEIGGLVAAPLVITIRARDSLSVILALLLGLALSVALPISALAQEPRGVLMVHSFGRDFSPWAEFAQSLQTHLIQQSKEPLDLYEASIYTARFQKPDNEHNLAEYLHNLSAKRKLDLVVTIGAPAASFVLHNRQRLFPTTSLLITGLADRRTPRSSLTANDAVVAVDIDFSQFIENILRLRPQTKEIAVVLGNSELERFWLSEMKRAFEPFLDRVKFTWLNELSLAQMVQRVAALPPQSAIFYFLVAVDGAGVTQPLDRAFAPLRKAAAAPIFSYADTVFGKGAVGGPMMPEFEGGRQAAAVVLRILEGEIPGDIKTRPILVEAPIYDWRELQRWGISESLLPPGSTVRFRELTAWDRYWWQILLAAAVMAIQTFLIIVLIHEHRRRALAEVEVRQRVSELATMNRRAVAGELSASIAHEINQPLAAIVSTSSAALRWLNRKTRRTLTRHGRLSSGSSATAIAQQRWSIPSGQCSKRTSRRRRWWMPTCLLIKSLIFCAVSSRDTM